MWNYEHSVEANVSPDAVWKLYSDASTWQEWDFGIESMDLDGPFATGSEGRLTPRGREAIPFRLVEVAENRGFTDVTEIAGLVLRFIHRLDPLDGGRTRITHRVEITGPAAEAAGPEVGAAVTAGIPTTVATLAELAAK